MGNPSFASTCYPRITLIGYTDLGTRVVHVVEVLVDFEWSVLCVFRITWIWTREVSGVYEYTPEYRIYIFT